MRRLVIAVRGGVLGTCLMAAISNMIEYEAHHSMIRLLVAAACGGFVVGVLGAGAPR